MQDKFVWTVKVSEKGQIAIPKQAREVFNISTGETLLLLGDVERGLALVKAEDYLNFAKVIIDANMGNKNDWG